MLLTITIDEIADDTYENHIKQEYEDQMSNHLIRHGLRELTFLVSNSRDSASRGLISSANTAAHGFSPRPSPSTCPSLAIGMEIGPKA